MKDPNSLEMAPRRNVPLPFTQSQKISWCAESCSSSVLCVEETMTVALDKLVQIVDSISVDGAAVSSVLAVVVVVVSIIPHVGAVLSV